MGTHFKHLVESPEFCLHRHAVQLLPLSHLENIPQLLQVFLNCLLQPPENVQNKE